MKELTKKEKAWINKLQKCLDSQPKTLSIFDCESGLVVFKSEDLPTTEYLCIDSTSDTKKCVIRPRLDRTWSCGCW